MLEKLVTDSEGETPVAYMLGQLTCALEKAGFAPHAAEQVSHNLRGVLSKGLVESIKARKGHSAEVGQIMDRLSPYISTDQATDGFPVTLTNEQWGSFWIGYYHFRAGKKTGPEEKKTARLDMRVTPTTKEWVNAQGGVAYVERLIAEDQARNTAEESANVGK